MFECVPGSAYFLRRAPQFCSLLCLVARLAPPPHLTGRQFARRGSCGDDTCSAQRAAASQCSCVAPEGPSWCSLNTPLFLSRPRSLRTARRRLKQKAYQIVRGPPRVWRSRSCPPNATVGGSMGASFSAVHLLRPRCAHSTPVTDSPPVDWYGHRVRARGLRDLLGASLPVNCGQVRWGSLEALASYNCTLRHLLRAPNTCTPASPTRPARAATP